MALLITISFFNDLLKAIGSALGGVVSPNPKGWQISQHSFSINNNLMFVHSLSSGNQFTILIIIFKLMQISRGERESQFVMFE